MTDTGADQRSPLTRFLDSVKKEFDSVRDELAQAAPEMLEEVATETKKLAQFFDDKAKKARARAEKKAVPESAEHPESARPPSTGE
jgi:uncharacterized membrane-anchored protein YhcB (DUF1043 family)